MTKEEIATILKDSRVKAGLTQRQAAERVGKKQQTIASWESGQSQPDANTLFVLFEIYNISVDEAFGFRKNPTKLATDEYPIMTKYRRLNDSGKEYIDAQLDFALSQEKYKGKLPLIDSQGAQVETNQEESAFVDVSYAAYGGDSGTFQISREQFNEAKKLFDEYDYRTDK